MARTEDLETNIRGSYELVREYEDKLRYSNDPKEKARCREEIEDQWKLIRGYLEEYLRLCKRLDHNVPADLREIIAPPTSRQPDRLAVAESTSPSPFIFGPAIQDPAGFYGRQDELRTILEQLGKRSCTAVVGERRIGKSSLLLQVARQMPEAKPTSLYPLPIYLDLMQPYIHTCRGIMRVIRGRLVEAGVDAGWCAEQDGDVAEFSYAAAQWPQAGLYPVLLLDEMDQLTGQADEFEELFKSWRAAGQLGHIVLVTASRRPLADLCRNDGVTSPFPNIFTQVRLRLLDERDWQQLVQDGFARDGIPLASSVMDWIRRVAGGHPFYTQIAAHLLYQAGGRLDETALTDQFIEQAENNLADLWRHQDPLRQAALKHLAGVAGVPRPAERTLKDLRRRGLVRGNQPFSTVWAQGIREGWWV